MQSTDTGKLIKALKSGTFQTVPGKIGFDRKGDVSAPGYVLDEWQSGKYDYFK